MSVGGPEERFLLSRYSSARALSSTPRSAQYPHEDETTSAAWRNPTDNISRLSLPHHRYLNWPVVGALIALAAFWVGVGVLIWWLA